MTRSKILAMAAAALGVGLGACGSSQTKPATGPATMDSTMPMGSNEVPTTAGSAGGEHSCGAGMKDGHCGADSASSATPPK